MADTHNIIIENVTHDITDGVVKHEVITEVVSHEIGAEQGPPGPPGKSSYEVYMENGGTLSEIDWINSFTDSYNKIEIEALLDANFANYYTTQEIDNRLDDFYTKPEIDTKIIDGGNF